MQQAKELRLAREAGKARASQSRATDIEVLAPQIPLEDDEEEYARAHGAAQPGTPIASPSRGSAQAAWTPSRARAAPQPAPRTPSELARRMLPPPAELVAPEDLGWVRTIVEEAFFTRPVINPAFNSAELKVRDAHY